MTANVQQSASPAVPGLRDKATAWLETQHARGRLTARERVELLLDVGSATEVDGRGAQAGNDDSDGVITVKGSIGGRAVCVFSKDMSVSKGSLSENHARKICELQQLALESRVPLIGIFDTAGLRLEDGMKALAGYGAIVRNSVAASGVVPQISLLVGGCPGADALLPPLSDFLFMANDDSSLFVSAPDLVKSVTNEEVDAAALGGAEVHTTVSSLADGACDNDVLAILKLRRLFAFLPLHNRDAAVGDWTSFDTADREAPGLDSLLPREPTLSYDVKELIEQVCDEGDFFELKSDFARNLVIGFARINGRSVGIVANQSCQLAGVLDGDAACKAARFVRFCDAFGLAVLSFVDTPGFLPGVAQEHGAIAKHVAKLLHAYAQATVPLITVVLGKAFGAAGTAMGSRAIGADIVYAWPDAQIGLLKAEAAVALRPMQANDSAALDEARRCLGANAAASDGHVDDVITPRHTRRHLAHALDKLAQKSSPQAWRKHANIPL